jgi:hypothetical protein
MARIGGHKCGCCGYEDATVSKTATGTLSLNCHRCEFSGFAKSGTKAHRLVSAGTTLDPEYEDPADQVPKPAQTTPAGKPAKPKVPNSVFDLASL